MDTAKCIIYSCFAIHKNRGLEVDCIRDFIVTLITECIQFACKGLDIYWICLVLDVVLEYHSIHEILLSVVSKLYALWHLRKMVDHVCGAMTWAHQWQESEWRPSAGKWVFRMQSSCQPARPLFKSTMQEWLGSRPQKKLAEFDLDCETRRTGCDRTGFTRYTDTSALLLCTGFGSKCVYQNITCSIIWLDKGIVFYINIAVLYGSSTRNNLGLGWVPTSTLGHWVFFFKMYNSTTKVFRQAKATTVGYFGEWLSLKKVTY